MISAPYWMLHLSWAAHWAPPLHRPAGMSFAQVWDEFSRFSRSSVLTVLGDMTGLRSVARNFHKAVHRAHEHVYETAELKLVDSWSQKDTVDAWRHARMYQCIDPILKRFPGSRWITIGDGRYGTDAHYLEQNGVTAVATDICDLLLQRAKEKGFIREYRKENAEQLSLADDSFDFALCKESYHHLPRPMLALYEMLRVARKGVVLIEPDERPVLIGLRHLFKMLIKEALITAGLGRFFSNRSTDIIDVGSNWYEEVGNFGFAVSPREIERVALGLNLPQVAFLGINDAYIKGVEYEPADDRSQVFRQIRQQIAEMDRHSRRGLSRVRYKLLVALIMKEPIDSSLREQLLAKGFEIRDLPSNPYLKGDAPAASGELQAADH
jgi:ubiquinone/menaquinone biosynthesis C-methylase UbiE